MPRLVCPWWIGYLLACPLRRLLQNPEEILQPYVQPGMTVLDTGCAMGFFSLPLARLVGSAGRVVAVDLQERMIRSLQKRAARAGLAGRIQTRVCTAYQLGIADLADTVDFGLVFAVVHEVPDPAALLAEIRLVMTASGRLLIAEPAGHVSLRHFDQTIALAEEAGFSVSSRPRISRSHSVLLQVKAADGLY